MNISAALLGLIGPFLVWPVERFLPYPHIIEELFKILVVFFVLKDKPSLKEGLKTVINAGVLFASTETVLYSININAYGNINLLFTRFFATSILHSFTFALTFLLGRKRMGIIIGFLTAVLIHFLYNRYIGIYLN